MLFFSLEKLTNKLLVVYKALPKLITTQKIL
jgi:hypothetical protein